MLVNNQVQIRDQVNQSVTQGVKAEDIASLDKALLQSISPTDIIADNVIDEEHILNISNTINSQLKSEGFFNGLSKDDSHLARAYVVQAVQEMYSIEFSDNRFDIRKPNIYQYFNTGKGKLFQYLGLEYSNIADREKMKRLGGIFADIAVRDIYSDKARDLLNRPGVLYGELSFAIMELALHNPNNIFDNKERLALKNSMDTLLINDNNTSQEDVELAKATLQSLVNKAKEITKAEGTRQGFNSIRTDTILDYIFKYADGKFQDGV